MTSRTTSALAVTGDVTLYGVAIVGHPGNFEATRRRDRRCGLNGDKTNNWVFCGRNSFLIDKIIAIDKTLMILYFDPIDKRIHFE